MVVKHFSNNSFIFVLLKVEAGIASYSVQVSLDNFQRKRSQRPVHVGLDELIYLIVPQKLT